MESPGSPLSELSSDDFQEDTRGSVHSASPDPFRDQEYHGDTNRPSKRQKTSNRNGSVGTAWEQLPPPPLDGDISSDTDGSVPGSPHIGSTSAAAAAAAAAGDDEEGGGGGREQVTVCKWEGCEAGDLGNMDLLVSHLHDEHIQARQKKYSCEWADCSRKGIAHASGYALRAHMRSHTREKPFYCSLPECDRSFTRSDALAKHMRTVHETEALRPSDPVPKHHSSNPQNKLQRLRLTLKVGGPNGISTDASSNKDPGSAMKGTASNPGSPGLPLSMGADAEYEHNNVIYVPSGTGRDGFDRVFPSDIHFTPEELALPASQLLALLHHQAKWALEDQQGLRAELEVLEQQRKSEWFEKELTLENMMDAEFAVKERQMALRKDRLAHSVEEMDATLAMRGDVVASRKLPIEPSKDGVLPWWRRNGVRPVNHGGGGDLPPTGMMQAQPPRPRPTLDDLVAAVESRS